MKLTPRPICIDCGHEALQGETWSITPEGWWLCNDCWNDSFDNDNDYNDYLKEFGLTEMTHTQCEARPACDCKNCKYDQ